MPGKITEVTGILKGINLPVAVREPLVRTGDPIQHHRKVSWRIARTYNVFASTCARSHLDAFQNSFQFRVALSAAQISEFPDHGAKYLRLGSRQQVGHVQSPKLGLTPDLSALPS